MQVVSSLVELNKVLDFKRKEGASIGFCPTMGFLHEGHLSLVKDCKNENDICVVSIYVNPSQFNEKSDFDNYPKDLARDKELLEKAQCDILWIPQQSEIESIPLSLNYELNGLDQMMEGAHRPGHFKGVIEVVYRLFKAVNPDISYFGEKDFQQFCIIEQMVKNNALPVKVLSRPTVRESDGLAMSSRNVRLSPEHRKIAPLLFKVLEEVSRDSEANENNLNSKYTLQLNNAGFKVEYLTLHAFPRQNKRVFVAAKLGAIRLIDNLAIK